MVPIPILPATNNQTLVLVVGTGSTTYVTSGYMQNYLALSTTTSITNETAASSLLLAGAFGVNNATSQGVNGNFNITGFLANQRVSVTGISQYQNASNPRQEISSGGHNSNSTAKTAIKISFLSGNIASGTASLYGIKS